MKGRTGWFILLGFVVVFVAIWDIAAARTNGESLTYTFRRNVAETWWRWPVGLLLLLLLAHLFMPPSLRKYDPIDALYRRYNPAYHQETVFVPEEDDGQAPVDVQSPP
jgi:hypothetical protein